MTTFLNRIREGVRDFFGADYTDYYTVQKNPIDGKWNIYDRDGFAVSSYSRRRDAIRGAERNGYTLV